MTTYNFFVMCPENGFEVFETLDDALDAADERIKGYLVDGWSEDVTGVCAGKITHRAKMCDQVFPDGEIDEDGIDEAGEYWDPDFDCKCNYKMIAHHQQAPEVAKLIEAPVKPMPDLPVDTKVLVWDSRYERKLKRHFSHFENGALRAFDRGHTSWTGGPTSAWPNWELAE